MIIFFSKHSSSLNTSIVYSDYRFDVRTIICCTQLFVHARKIKGTLYSVGINNIFSSGINNTYIMKEFMKTE